MQVGEGDATSQEKKQRQFSGKPQISITDTSGHVTDVISEGENDMSPSETKVTADTLAVTSGTYRTFHSSSSSPSSHQPSPTRSHPPLTHSHSSPASPNHHPPSSFPAHPSNYNSLIFGNYVTNLAAIPPHVSDFGNPKGYSIPDPIQANIPYTCMWGSPQPTSANRSQRPSSGLVGASRQSSSGVGVPNSDSSISCDGQNSNIYNGDRNLIQDMDMSVKQDDGRMGNHVGDVNLLSHVDDRNLLTHVGDVNLLTHFGDVNLLDSPGVNKTQGSNINLASKLTVGDILQELKRILGDRGKEVVYQCSDHLFRLENSNVQMELEVCQGVSYNGLQVRRISGDKGHYRALCQELLSGINL